MHASAGGGGRGWAAVRAIARGKPSSSVKLVSRHWSDRGRCASAGGGRFPDDTTVLASGRRLRLPGTKPYMQCFAPFPPPAIFFLPDHRETCYATTENQLLPLTYGLDKNHSSHRTEYQFLNIFNHFFCFHTFATSSVRSFPLPRSCGGGGARHGMEWLQFRLDCAWTVAPLRASYASRMKVSQKSHGGQITVAS